MNVTILDTVTGQKYKVASVFDDYWWAQGNGSCDCNRAGMTGNISEQSNVCLGKKRFLIVAAANSQYSLRELNAGYPDALVEKYIGTNPPSWNKAPINP